MPHLFEYSNPITDRPRFECTLIEVRCQHISILGDRCSKVQCIGAEFCARHLQTDHCLKISTSTLRGCGLGLFASDARRPDTAIVFAYYPKRKRGDFIIKYTGEVISDKETDARYGQGNTVPYGARLSATNNVDAACLRGAGSLANHKQRRHANARLICTRTSVYLEATKHIRNGDEIFIDYGGDYNICKESIEFSHQTRAV